MRHEGAGRDERHAVSAGAAIEHPLQTRVRSATPEKSTCARRQQNPVNFSFGEIGICGYRSRTTIQPAPAGRSMVRRCDGRQVRRLRADTAVAVRYHPVSTAGRCSGLRQGLGRLELRGRALPAARSSPMIRFRRTMLSSVRRAGEI